MKSFVGEICACILVLVFIIQPISGVNPNSRRYFLHNEDICNYDNVVTKVNLEAVPTYASYQDVNDAKFCQLPYKSCAHSSHVKRCCEAAKSFCLLQDKSGPCGNYCGCWLHHCES